jgi:hypothetical protein
LLSGAPLSVQYSGHASLPTCTKPLHLNNVLISPYLIKNLISVRALTRDNSVSVEFDPYGFSIKDLRTRMVLLQCDSTGDLYPLRPTSSSASAGSHGFLAAHDNKLWHARLGHPGNDSLHRILRSSGFSCSKSDKHSCHACRLSKHARLPFSSSNNVAAFPFHLVLLDDYSHFAWTFPLRQKSDVPTLISFHVYTISAANSVPADRQWA